MNTLGLPKDIVEYVLSENDGNKLNELNKIVCEKKDLLNKFSHLHTLKKHMKLKLALIYEPVKEEQDTNKLYDLFYFGLAQGYGKSDLEEIKKFFDLTTNEAIQISKRTKVPWLQGTYKECREIADRFDKVLFDIRPTE